MTESNRQVLLASRPEGKPTESNFRIKDGPLPSLGEGQVLVRNQWLSIDPYMRGRMMDIRTYAEPVALGDVMVGDTAGIVVESRHPGFAVGDAVAGHLGWQRFGAIDGSLLRKVDTTRVPLSAGLGVAGMPGVTAYVGLIDLCAPQAGETVVVTAASGGVGSVAGQLARLRGCRVVGVAGGADKCRHVVDDLGFDACIDYKAADFKASLKAALPDGVNCIFDNVGGSAGRAPAAPAPRCAHHPVRRHLRGGQPQPPRHPPPAPADRQSGEGAGFHRRRSPGTLGAGHR